MMQAIVTISSAILMISITAATQVELNIDDISPRNVRVGRLLPRNPHAIIGQMFQAWCVLDRRKLLRSLNITVDDVFFRFATIKDQTPVTVPRKYMKTVNQSTVELAYPNITIDFHRGIISCVARVNQTSVLFIDDHLLYAGYRPGVGNVVKVITEDLITVRVTFAKTHENPSYPTTFSLLCRFRENENFSDCPNQTKLANDTIGFLTRHNPGERFGDNQQPIRVLVKSSSLLGGTAIGGLTTFSLYEKFKPQPVSGIVVTYSGGQTARVQWTYPDLVPLGLQYKLVVNCKWDQHPKVYTLSGTYFEIGPFSVNLTGLHWATTYNLSILVKPVIKGYPSDMSEMIQFTTEESIPAANPSVIGSGYERRVNDKKQDIVIYWQPVPEFFQHGVITETIVQMLVNQKVKYFTVNESEAVLYQAHVKDLLVQNSYLFAIMIGTSKGVCHHINNTVSVPSLETVLPLIENLTAIITKNTEGKHVVQLSWKPYLLRHQRLLVHWCIGRYGYRCQGVLNTFAVKAGESNYTFYGLVEPYVQYKFGASVESNSSNTGLQWVNCTYNIAEVPQKPTEVQSAEVGEHHAYIYVAPGICTLAQGYAYQLTVVIQDGNQAVVATQSFPVNPSGRYKVTSLKPGHPYTLAVYSESVKGRSNQALEIHLKTEPADIKLILSFCIFGAVSIVIVFVSLYCCRFFKKFRERIPIKVPQVHDEPHLDPRQVPDGGYETVTPKESLDAPNQKSIQSDDDNDKEDTAEIISLTDVCWDDSLSIDENEDQEYAEQTFSGHRSSPEGNTSPSSSPSVGSNSMSTVLPMFPDVDTDNSVDSIEQYPQCHMQLSPPQPEPAVFQQLYARGQAEYSDSLHDADFVSTSQPILRLDDEDSVGSTEEETSPKLPLNHGYI